jgi:hypothetical protein
MPLVIKLVITNLMFKHVFDDRFTRERRFVEGLEWSRRFDSAPKPYLIFRRGNAPFFPVKSRESENREREENAGLGKEFVMQRHV